MSWHQWLSTDSGDQCIRCGLAVDHEGDESGPIPLICPGPDVRTPHHFILVGADDDVLDCAYCSYKIDDTTEAVSWECEAER